VSRAEWAAFDGCREKRRDGFSYGPTVRRDDARGGGCMRHAWSGHGGRSTAPARGGGSGRAAVTRATPVSELWLEVLHTGWWLHAQRVKAGRQVARVREAAGVVGTQLWRSASSRGRNGTQVRACKPATRWARPVYAGVALGWFRNRVGQH
jgi:hypothetical protein